ncbi:MAG: AarF/ABC1/UbiB kinase family protein [Gammaproteobacteria bacterium]|nr:AarF/ABC1/UbiB kinase family protein [Gammaproteobacteria bacterium]
MSRDDFITSAFGRFVKVGGLVGRVGVSMLGEQAVGLLRDGPTQQLKKAENMVRNAIRIADTLGELKGAAMKVGQMLSLHEGLFPPEVSAVLSMLQKEAPSVSFEVMERELRRELDNFDELFESLQPEAFAAASIGQVHRGVLRDGREVAVKIQYPDADRMVKADLKNLKALLGNLVSLFTDIDFEPIWEEVRERLLEELDYLKEADNIRRTAAMQTDCPEIIVPGVVQEATSRRVLTMEFVDGIPPGEAVSNRYPQDLRDQWGVTLFEFTLRGLLEHRFLHADPNFANFAFREDGTVAVYDFGCMKEIPADLAAGYSRLMDAVIHRRKAAIPRILRDMGVFKEGGAPLRREMTDPYVDLVQDIVKATPRYTFGEDSSIYETLYELGMSNWQDATDIRFPRDVVFIDRTLVGLFGNLGKLRATGPWRRLLLKYTAPRSAARIQ